MTEQRSHRLEPVISEMRVDAHQHFWKYDSLEYDWIDDRMAALRRDFLPADFGPVLKYGGFDGSVAVQARQSLDETRWLLELAEKSPFVLGVVGWVDLRSPDLRAQLERFAANPKFVGVRHVIQSEPDDRFLLRSDFLRGVGMLAEFGLTYDILIYPRQLPAAIEFVRKFPNQPFVLDHLAKPPIASGMLEPWASGIRELAKSENVWCKVSGMVTEAEWGNRLPQTYWPYLDVVFEAFGTKRLMFGSDWPVCTVAASYGDVFTIVAKYLEQFSSGEKDGVFGGNAARFWTLMP
jgi:L-fuconolactonase